MSSDPRERALPTTSREPASRVRRIAPEAAAARRAVARDAQAAVPAQARSHDPAGHDQDRPAELNRSREP